MSGIEVTSGVDAVLLGLRCTVGVMIFLHGYNHLWGAGGVAGTARWFGGLGFRPARVHAVLSGTTELAAGVALVLGLGTALACAALVGTMAVAGWAVHRPNGFFIFKDGFEYVLVVAAVAIALAAVGPGTWSVDASIGVVDYGNGDPGLMGTTGAQVAAAGLLGAFALLVVGWRPRRDSHV